MLSLALNPADLLRLLPLPIFLWISWKDIQTRRVPNRVWPPLIIYGLLLIPVDIHHVWTTAATGATAHALQTILTITITIPLAILLWRIGGWGGADAKALITLSILFPTYPTYLLPGDTLPLVVAPHTIFPLTILTNTVIVVAAIILLRAIHTLARIRELTPLALIGKPVQADTLPNRHGRLLEDRNGKRLDGIDLDSVKNYLEWRNISLDELPEHRPDGDEDDPWQAEAFTDDHDNVYTPSEDDLRSTLAHLADTEEDEWVWITPGLPFLVYFTIGLILALLVGSILTALIPLPTA